MTDPGTVFRFVDGAELCLAHFDEWPVWSEYYDFCERDEIESWGVNREWMDEQLAPYSGGTHPVYPVIGPNPLPERMRIFIGATLTTAGGQSVRGYLMNEDAYLVTLVVDGVEFSFSRNPSIRSLQEPRLPELRTMLGGDAVFPLSYVSMPLGASRQTIVGTFAPWMLD